MPKYRVRGFVPGRQGVRFERLESGFPERRPPWATCFAFLCAMLGGMAKRSAAMPSALFLTTRRLETPALGLWPEQERSP